MRLTVVAAVAALFLLTLQRTQAESDNKEDWSWNGDEKATEPPKEEEGRSRGVFVTANPDDDSEEMVLEQVLEAGRSGRALHGFDDVYTDPQVQQALHSGNDSQARHYIKERLCNLGLMQCDFEPKRPYVQPHELIYAQPIHIKPVGEPIPAVPVKGPAKALHYPAGPGGHYGPPNHFGPPNHYGPPPRPSYIAPPRPALHPPVYKPSYKPIGGPVYGPPKPVRPPPVYEEQEFSPGHKVIASVPAVATAGVQQHVHHHFHHPTGADKPTVVVDNLHQSPGAGYDHHDHHSLGVNGVFSGPVNGLDVSGSYGPSYSGESSYGSSGFYKKEFNLKPSSSNTLGSDSYLASSSHQTGRQDGAGGQCYCVPYDQCLPHEIARKEDFGYAIDPRNNDKGIEAEIDSSEVVHITDANGTNVATERIPSANNEEKTETRRRREAPAEHKAEDSKKAPRETPSSSAAEASPSARQLGSFGGSGGGGGDGNKLKVSPTFGVSFGLPGGQGYPAQPFGQYPAGNPYGSAVGGGGIDLGLVSVNPLVSIQVTKDEYGEKVVKPLVNLHITPNHQLVHKVGSILHHKKQYLLTPPFHHQHHHVHTGYHEKPYPYPYPQKPYPYYPSHKPSYHPHHYAPDYHHYAPEHHPYQPEYPDYDEYPGYYDDGYGYGRQGSARIESNATNGVQAQGGVRFPQRAKRDAHRIERQANYFGGGGQCGPRQVCCRRPQPLRAPPGAGHGQCGRRNAQGINGRIKNPSYVDGDSEFGEYPWQVAILKKDTQESVYVCGGTLIDALHIITAAHCVKTYNGPELRVRLGEWDVNHDVEFYPYVERDVARVTIHPEFYAGTLANDIAILRLAGSALDLSRAPHISPACLPSPGQDYTGSRCWTTGWGKDAFGEFGKYQNILKEVDIPVVSHHQCQSLLQQTRLGYEFKLHPGMLCAGGEEGKDACKGDGGGPMVCEKGGSWQVVGIVSWGIGCGQYGVPGVYVKVAHYADWIRAITSRF